MCAPLVRQAIQTECTLNAQVPRYYANWTQQASWQADGGLVETFTESMDVLRKM
jgi:hypothetical protein